MLNLTLIGILHLKVQNKLKPLVHSVAGVGEGLRKGGARGGKPKGRGRGRACA